MKAVKNPLLPEITRKKTKPNIINIILIEAVAVGFFLWFHFSLLHKKEESKKQYEQALAQSALIDDKMMQVRDSAFQLIKPLRLTDVK